MDDAYTVMSYRPRAMAGIGSVVGFLVLIVGLAIGFGFVLAQSQWFSPLLHSRLDACRTDLVEVQAESKAFQDEIAGLKQHIHELESAPAQQTSSLLLPVTAVNAFSLFAVAAVLLYRTLLASPKASRRHPSTPQRNRHLIAPAGRADADEQAPETEEEKAERASRLMHFHH